MKNPSIPRTEWFKQFNKLLRECSKSFATYQLPLSNRCVGSDSIIVMEWRLLFLSRQLLSAFTSIPNVWFSCAISLASLMRWWWWWWWCLRFDCSFLVDFRGEFPKFPLLALLSFVEFDLDAPLVLNIRLIWCTSNDWFPWHSLGCSRKFGTLKITHNNKVLKHVWNEWREREKE